MFEMNIKYIYPIIGIVGGTALIIGSIKKRPNVAAWSRIAVRLAGFFSIIWGIMIIIQMSHIITNVIAGRLIQSFKTFFGGIGVGILITLFLSGELSFSKWKNKIIKMKHET